MEKTEENSICDHFNDQVASLQFTCIGLHPVMCNKHINNGINLINK